MATPLTEERKLRDRLLGAHLAHLQAQARHIAGLYFEYINHPDHQTVAAVGLKPAEVRFRDHWGRLQFWCLELGSVQLRNFSQLALPGGVEQTGGHTSYKVRQFFRMPLHRLAGRIEKRRRGNPAMPELFQDGKIEAPVTDWALMWFDRYQPGKLKQDKEVLHGG
jgi:hypothetical protein